MITDSVKVELSPVTEFNKKIPEADRRTCSDIILPVPRLQPENERLGGIWVTLKAGIDVSMRMIHGLLQFHGG